MGDSKRSIFVADPEGTEWWTPKDLEEENLDPMPKFEIGLACTGKDRPRVADLWGQYLSATAASGMTRASYQAIDALTTLGVRDWRGVEVDFSRAALLNLEYPIKAAIAARYAENCLGFTDSESRDLEDEAGN